jgi:hypothetical protein
VGALAKFADTGQISFSSEIDIVITPSLKKAHHGHLQDVSSASFADILRGGAAVHSEDML